MKKIFILFLSSLFSFAAFAENLAATAKQAEAGDAEAQYALALSYIFSDTYKEEEAKELYKKALYLAEKSAAQGNANGEALLGSMYLKGIGVEIDKKKAFELINKSAQKENSYGIFYLSAMYFHGIEVDVDRNKASELIDKAVKMKNPAAMFSVAYIYLNGLMDTEQDLGTAAELLEELAKQDIKDLQDRQYVRDAQYSLAGMYLDGIGVKKNSQKALEWYTKSAENGNVDSMFSAAEMYRKGTDIKADDEKAFAFYEKSASVGHRIAKVRLACMYMSGKLVKQDYKKAFELAKEAQMSQGAKVILAYMYLKGLGVEKNKKEAIEMYEILYGHGFVQADLILAEIYSGDGNNEKAVEIFTYAAKKKSFAAIYALDRLYSAENSPYKPNEDDLKSLEELKKSLTPEDLKKAESEFEEIKKFVHDDSYTIPNNDWFAEVEKMINSQK